MTIRIEIASAFSRSPAGRYRTDGPFSGERFRDDVLAPALSQGSVELILDGVASLPSSFLEEITGGLIRKGFTIAELEAKLKIIASTRLASYPTQGWQYIRDAHKRANEAA